MELTFETFRKGLKWLDCCYLNLEVEPCEFTYWYQILKKKFSDDGLFPVIFRYCQSESELTGPEDIVRFANQLLVDHAPSAEKIVNTMIESVKSLQNKPNATVPESLKNKIKASYRGKLYKSASSQIVSLDLLKQLNAIPIGYDEEYFRKIQP